MTITALLQARTSSTRLPGKVLKSLCGQPMILRQIERIRRASLIDRLIVVTSTDKSDDRLVAICEEADVEVFRGCLSDVLTRFYTASVAFKLQHVVRLTADCPLADPTVIDAVVRFYLDNRFDYASNVLERTFPDGLDVEIFDFGALEAAHKSAVLASQREHVTSFIYQHPERFRLGGFKGDCDLSTLRWTVDEPADFEFVSAVYDKLYGHNPAFVTEDILDLLAEEPTIIAINGGAASYVENVKLLLQSRMLRRKV